MPLPTPGLLKRPLVYLYLGADGLGRLALDVVEYAVDPFVSR